MPFIREIVLFSGDHKMTDFFNAWDAPAISPLPPIIAGQSSGLTPTAVPSYCAHALPLSRLITYMPNKFKLT